MLVLESRGLSPGVRELLQPLAELSALRCVEMDLAWFLAQEVVPPRVSARGTACADAQCKHRRCTLPRSEACSGQGGCWP